MENKNKGLAFVLAAVLSLSLAACGDKKPAESEEKEKETTTTTAAPEESKPEETTTAPAETTAPEDEIVTSDETAELPPEETPTEEETKSAVLEEIGTIEDKDLYFYNNASIYTGTSDDDVKFMDYMGEELDGGEIPFVTDLGDTGLYAFCKTDKDIVYQGIMDREGNVILGADQGVGTIDAIDDRFVKAYFPEGETKDKNEAIYFVSANQFAFQPSDDDILYKGTVKVFDTKTGKFLENTAQKFDPTYHVDGDIISYYDADSNQIYVNTDDKIVDAPDYSIAGKFFTGYKDGKTVVYDHELKEVLSTDYSVMKYDGTDYYYRVRDNEKGLDGVMSAMGRVLIEPKYKSVMGIDDTYFSYSTDSKYGLAKFDGTELTKDEYGFVSKVAPGYFTAKCDDNKLALLDKTGKEIVKESDDINLYALDEAIYITKGDEYCYLVYNDNDFTIKLSSGGTYLGNYLLYSSKDKAVYDIITGEKVLDGFDKVYAAYGHLYVLNGDEYTVYDIK